MALPSTTLPFLASLAALLVATSVIGDGIHALLHVSLRGRGPWRWPGLLHHSHHLFLDEQLAFHEERYRLNVALHQVPELLMRLLVATVIALAVDLDSDVLGALAAVAGIDFGMVVMRRGRDRFHPTRRPVGPPASGIVVDSAYHAFHHAFPEHFLAAHLQLVDRVLGRLLPLQGRRVVVVGASSYGADLAVALSTEGADVAHQAEDAIDVEAIGAADVVVLGHGAGWRDHRAYEAILAAALAKRPAASVLPLDVWAIGEDSAWLARRAVFADRVILRQLRRGPDLGATTTLFWLKRGARDL